MSELREKGCRNGHPAERSYRMGVTAKWVCRDCGNERDRKRRSSQSGTAAHNAKNRASWLRRKAEQQARQLETELTDIMAPSKSKGYPPPWKPGLGHCAQDSDNPDWIRRPGPDTAYLLSTCNGRQGLPACPMKAQCLVWAKDQPYLVGIAGGEMFGENDKEESAA